MENVLPKSFTNMKALVKRNGYNQYNANRADGTRAVLSLYEANFQAGGKLLTTSSHSSSSVLKSCDSPYTGSWSSIGSGSKYGYKLEFALMQNRVYMANETNGATFNEVWDGTNLLEIGCPPPDNTLITVTQVGGGGALSAGVYRYLVTFLYDGVQESGAITYYDYTNTRTFAPAQGGINLNDSITLAAIPLGNARVTARKIYRTKVSDSTVYYLLTTINDNTTVTYLDTTGDASLVTPINPVLLLDLKKPFISKYNMVHQNRLIYGNLTENLYTAMASSDITLTQQTTAGAHLTLLGTYKYRFYKCWHFNTGGADPQLVLSPYVEIAITLTGTNNQVTIAYGGTDTWFSLIAVQRSDNTGGAGTFKWQSLTGNYGFIKTLGLVDSTTDAARRDSVLKIIPSGAVSNYNNFLDWSDINSPDLSSNIIQNTLGQIVPNANLSTIGDTSNPITGIFSDEGRIITFQQRDIFETNTRPQDPSFWVTNKIVSGIGADAQSIKQFPGGFVFKSNRTIAGLGAFDVIYLWDGRGKPEAIGYKTCGYMFNNNISTFKDLIYDASNEWIRVIETTGSFTYEFIYDINLGIWFTWTNTATDLGFSVYGDTKSYGVIIGDNYGYLMNYGSTLWQDKINNSNTNYTLQWQTKTYELYDKDLRPRRVAIDVEKGANFTGLSLITSVDGISESTDSTSMADTGTGFNRLKSVLFSAANTKSYRQLYFRVTESSNSSCKILSFALDLTEEHQRSKGR